jgi:hypothetical protein
MGRSIKAGTVRGATSLIPVNKAEANYFRQDQCPAISRNQARKIIGGDTPSKKLLANRGPASTRLRDHVGHSLTRPQKLLDGELKRALSLTIALPRLASFEQSWRCPYRETLRIETPLQ